MTYATPIKLKKNKPKKLISIRIDPDLLKWLDKISDNRSGLIEAMIKKLKIEFELIKRTQE